MDNEQLEEPIDDDWETRVLCSDGNCIGLIGPDGRCKECGKPSDTPIREPLAEETGTKASMDDGADDSAVETDNPPPPSLEETASPIVAGDEWENRILCIDGNCIGVVGPDGRCKECGKPYEKKRAG